MKTFVVACTAFVLAAAAGTAMPQKAEAFFFSAGQSKDCHRVETHLFNVTYIWVCKASGLPWWWTRNETGPIYSHHSNKTGSTPAPAPAAPVSPSYTPPT